MTYPTQVLLPYGFLLGEIEKNEKSFSIKPLKNGFFVVEYAIMQK